MKAVDSLILGIVHIFKYFKHKFKYLDQDIWVVTKRGGSRRDSTQATQIWKMIHFEGGWDQKKKKYHTPYKYTHSQFILPTNKKTKK